MSGRNERSESLLELMPRCMDSWQVFGQLMSRTGLIHPEALDDPMGYDNGKTEGLVIDLHALIVEYFARKHQRQFVRVCAVAQPVMEAWAKDNELDEWHCRCEDLFGTAYPRNLCPVCCVESSVNWREGKPYSYCPDHGELEDLYSEANAEMRDAMGEKKP